MSWVYEIALRGEADAGAAAWFDAGPRAALAALPGLNVADMYTPAQGSAKDPYNHDDVVPALLVTLDFKSKDELAAVVKSGAIAKALGNLPGKAAVTGAAFERIFYPVGSNKTPAPLEAPYSYVVRYHRPAEDEAAFIDNYIATHPVTQAALPAIRAIMCYLVLDDINATAQLPSGNYMIGNEVVFDDLAAFNAAMASPVREELRAHFREFPKFSGGNTHFPMMRKRFVG